GQSSDAMTLATTLRLDPQRPAIEQVPQQLRPTGGPGWRQGYAAGGQNRGRGELVAGERRGLEAIDDPRAGCRCSACHRERYRRLGFEDVQVMLGAKMAEVERLVVWGQQVNPGAVHVTQARHDVCRHHAQARLSAGRRLTLRTLQQKRDARLKPWHALLPSGPEQRERETGHSPRCT